MGHEDGIPFFDFAVISVETEQRVDLAPPLLYIERETLHRATDDDFGYDEGEPSIGWADLTWTGLPGEEEELLETSIVIHQSPGEDDPDAERHTGRIDGRTRKNGNKHGGGVVVFSRGTGMFRGKRGHLRLRIQNPKRWSIDT
jgi:hypothetical protein